MTEAIYGIYSKSHKGVTTNFGDIQVIKELKDNRNTLVKFKKFNSIDDAKNWLLDTETQEKKNEITSFTSSSELFGTKNNVREVEDPPTQPKTKKRTLLTK